MACRCTVMTSVVATIYVRLCYYDTYLYYLCYVVVVKRKKRVNFHIELVLVALGDNYLHPSATPQIDVAHEVFRLVL